MGHNSSAHYIWTIMGSHNNGIGGRLLLLSAGLLIVAVRASCSPRPTTIIAAFVVPTTLQTTTTTTITTTTRIPRRKTGGCQLRSTTELGMGGFNRGGKQAELARKMALAKQQKSDGDDKLTVPVDESHQEKDETTILSAQELQLKQDHQLFAQLLKNSNLEKLTREKSARNDRTTTANPVSFTRTSFGSTNSNNTNNNSYGKAPRVAKNKKKKKAAKKEDKEEDYQALVLQEGDIARRPDFETLVSCASAKPLGNIEAAKLVPWVPPFLADYMVVLVDPRTQSGDLRKTLMYLSSTLEPRILEQLICINADSVAETTR